MSESAAAEKLSSLMEGNKGEDVEKNTLVCITSGISSDYYGLFRLMQCFNILSIPQPFTATSKIKWYFHYAATVFVTGDRSTLL